MEPTTQQLCSCCGRSKPRTALHALDGGAYICRGHCNGPGATVMGREMGTLPRD